MRTNINPGFILSFNDKTYNVRLELADAKSLLVKKALYHIYFNNTPFGKLVYKDGRWCAPQLIPESVVNQLIRNIEADYVEIVPEIVWN